MKKKLSLIVLACALTLGVSGCGSEADVSDASPRSKICLLAVKMFILQRESIVCALVDRQNKQI